ncbi:hypothetical protein PVAND_012256 [Polypedilum vanderplanki]|uniref:G-protein coupled receptors family 1 profile domain-containing protein n=1 Tax=Polypedilum vanderplanki TaxID=319348 RepID=A0A9J6CL15_POLVA|nr:hypothetical protein PVAND_012256 [Polypedilum vanderplanki]
MSMMVAIILSVIVSCLGIISNCSIIVLVVLTKQLNSPNRILLLHLSIICLLLSILYLWSLINNAILPSYIHRVDLPESLAITTVTTAGSVSLHNHYSSILSSHSSNSVDITSSTTASTSTATSTLRVKSVYDSVYSFNDLLIHLLQPISLWTISCINFDRYYAICSPLHYNTLLTTKKVTIFLCSGWMIIIFTIFPVYVMLMISGERSIMGVCFFKHMDVRSDWMRNLDRDYYWFEVQVLLTTLLTIFLPITLIIACNIRILTIANYQRHRIASAIYESVLSAQIAITHQKNPFPPIPGLLTNQPFPLATLYPPKPNSFEMQRKSQKATLVVFELLASIIVLYCPYYIFMIVFSFLRKSHSTFVAAESKQQYETVLNIIIYLVQFLMLCAPTVNAILYGFKNKTIQENIHNIWRKQKTKIELHYEIQARTPSTCGSRKASLTEMNMPHIFQPQLKRQLSDFFFGTSSSLMSHLNDDVSMFHSNKIYRTPSDSLYNPSSSGRRNSEFLSPNFDPLGKMTLPPAPANSPSSITKNCETKICLSHSTSKNLLSNFKKLIVGSKNDLNDDNDGTHDDCGMSFPKILITKHSDSLLTTHSTSRRDSSDIQQVAVEVEEEFAAEQEPLLTTQACSLENVNSRMSKSMRKFQTL